MTKLISDKKPLVWEFVIVILFVLMIDLFELMYLFHHLLFHYDVTGE